jgi:hypothetical protein
MDLYMNDCMYHIYGFSQPCLISLASCIRITYDIYSTTKLNEGFIINFTITILDLCATTQLQITIIKIIILIININIII